MKTHEFMSLREFLLLPDFDRPLYRSLYPHTWVLLYDIAKRSFEKYGSNGPPIGMEVMTLLMGRGGELFKFGGTVDKDERCFILVDNKQLAVLSDLSKDEMKVIRRGSYG
jgi:hypothetical protein